jgi:hypothetical protein
MWRYFAWTGGTGKSLKIFRWPANDKKLHEQELADVQVFDPDGNWRANQREWLFREMMSGWFDESDEISAQEAQALMARLARKP